jgi:SRSO17 transposase
MERCKKIFKTATHNKLPLGIQYIKGLFQGQKRNMERMTERVADSEYNQIQHFISESPWDARLGFDTVAQDTGKIFESYDSVALLIDESANRKKGQHSVGVARQWCGTIGKVDNCQVAVYAALSAEKYYGLIDTALYLPESWTEDKERCKKAKVPKERMTYKTKVELALDIVKHQIAIGTRFHYIGADGLYGNSYWFGQELDKLKQLFVLEVHSDQYVYTQFPTIYLPEKQGVKGRQPKLYKATGEVTQVSAIGQKIADDQWEKIRLRQTGKGDLNCLGYTQKVYVWDGHSSYYSERILTIRVTVTKDGKREYKYALSNAKENEFTTEELVRMQSQRYFVERSFQDAKQEAGMSQYQVRGWLAWHHHMVMVMMAMHFILSEKVLFKEEMPLLSAYDVREIMLNVYPRKGMNQRDVMEQIHKRHEQRRIQLSKNKGST